MEASGRRLAPGAAFVDPRPNAIDQCHEAPMQALLATARKPPTARYADVCRSDGPACLRWQGARWRWGGGRACSHEMAAGRDERPAQGYRFGPIVLRQAQKSQQLATERPACQLLPKPRPRMLPTANRWLLLPCPHSTAQSADVCSVALAPWTDSRADALSRQWANLTIASWQVLLTAVARSTLGQCSPARLGSRRLEAATGGDFHVGPRGGS